MYNKVVMKKNEPKQQNTERDDEDDLPKAYDSDTEMELYELWEKSGYFNPDNIKTGKKPFVISLPPPNANNRLHAGTTCGYSFQDCMGRYNRMKGHPTLLLPGKDHAGIQTESVFTKVLKEKGIDKWELGRDEFYKRAYAFCMDNAKHARENEKRLGLSADWSREFFTLDPKLTEIIYDTFYKMFEENLIYRGQYIVNQCTFCKTALANTDTEHKEKEGIFAYIRYPVAGKDNEFVTVATTRPETMLGDTAVAVHPEDDRYKDLVGKEVELPLTGRNIPVIADKAVDMEVGAAALKITPAHSAVDFKIGQEHGLEVINVINEEGVMTENTPEKYAGMTVKEAREAVLADLEEQGYLEKVEKIKHEVVVCERCGHTIEQIISKQWFVHMDDLAEKGIKSLDSGEITIHPGHQKKVLRSWFENIEPWCISRQLWWGHRIPIWYCGSKEFYDWLLDNPDKKADDYEKEMGKKANGCGSVVPGDKNPGTCPKCKGTHLEPETDLFDTWFSSGQWPYSTLGGPGAEDYKKYYPTDVMETARDILFFWVARMIMMGHYRTGKSPFHTVYLHGMILAPDGQKMSKSRGNTVQPDTLFDEYGADAVRLWYYTDTLPGQNTPVRYEKLKGNRNFINKIWNASRYVMLQVKDLSTAERKEIGELAVRKMEDLPSSVDIWAKEAYSSIENVTKYLDAYRFNLAVEEMREFFWHTYCDIWIEETKKKIEAKPEKKYDLLAQLIALLAVQMKVMHPFAPYVTERVWQSLRGLDLLPGESELLMMALWPVMKDS